MGSHLTRAGVWAACTPDTCADSLHLPGIDGSECTDSMLPLLLPLFEAVDPPRSRIGVGFLRPQDRLKVWNDDYNRVHRDYGLPAKIWDDGKLQWWLNGALHRMDGGPAVIEADGTQRWYHRGSSHRAFDLPAVVHASGALEWHSYGRVHRINGPAKIEADGTETWYRNGAQIYPS